MSAIGLPPGGNATLNPSPKNFMSGVRTSALSTPPAIMIEATRGPMIYPTPSNSGEISAEIEPAFSGAPKTFSGVSFHNLSADMRVLYTRPIPKPVKMALPLMPRAEEGEVSRF